MTLKADSLGSNLSFPTYELATWGKFLSSLCLSFLI